MYKNIIYLTQQKFHKPVVFKLVNNCFENVMENRVSWLVIICDSVNSIFSSYFSRILHSRFLLDIFKSIFNISFYLWVCFLHV